MQIQLIEPGKVNNVKRLQVALIGLGMMGRNHYRILRDLPGVKISYIVDLNLSAIPDTDSLLARSRLEDVNPADVDYCVISTPSALHEESIAWAIKNQIPFLVEKPLASSLVAAKRVLAASQKARVRGAVGHIERFNSAFLHAKKIVEEGAIGNIVEILTRRTGPYPGRIKDVGVIMDLATHDIDLVRWLSGSEYSSVYSQINSYQENPHEGLVHASGKLENGVLVNHIVNWVSPNKDRQMQILGENGKIIVDALTSDITLIKMPIHKIEASLVASLRGSSEGNLEKIAIEKREPLLVEHENFRDFINGLAANPVLLKDGVEALRVAEAMLESSRISQVVHL